MLRLMMLARDEAERLPVMAKRIAGLIGSACILVDDRTTDATREVARELWGDLDGGLIVEDFEFEDFGQARNRVLIRARRGLAASDYLLVLDPDSVPQGDLQLLIDPREGAIYGCEWRAHGLTWHSTILVRADAPASYLGRVHEVIDVPGEAWEILPSTIWVDAVVSAGSDRLELFERVLREDAATNPRSAFYLAQTLRDLGRVDEAFGWYMRRSAMGHGFDEETYIATLEAGMLLSVYDYELAAEMWRRCLKIRPRPEAPFFLAQQANNLGKPNEALSWASLGLQLSPTTDQLFVNRWIEKEGLPAEFQKAALALLPPGAIIAEPLPESHPGPVLATVEN